MRLTKNILEDLALVSATFIASGYFLLCLFGIGISLYEFNYNFFQILIMLFLLLGMLGYLGFLSLVFNGYEKKLKQSLILLIIGVVICFTALIVPGINRTEFISIASFGDFLEIVVAIWPILVAIYFIIKISKKLIQEKRKA